MSLALIYAKTFGVLNGKLGALAKLVHLHLFDHLDVCNTHVLGSPDHYQAKTTTDHFNTVYLGLLVIFLGSIVHAISLDSKLLLFENGPNKMSLQAIRQSPTSLLFFKILACCALYMASRFKQW